MFCKRILSICNKHLYSIKKYSVIASVLKKPNVGEVAEIKVVYNSNIIIILNELCKLSNK